MKNRDKAQRLLEKAQELQTQLWDTVHELEEQLGGVEILTTVDLSYETLASLEKGIARRRAMKYIFFVNVERHTDGYEPGHRLELAWSGEIDNQPRWSALRVLFEVFNIRRPAGYYNRSMSVGDVVVLDDREGVAAFACEPVGWEPVPVPELALVTGKQRKL